MDRGESVSAYHAGKSLKCLVCILFAYLHKFSEVSDTRVYTQSKLLLNSSSSSEYIRVSWLAE